MDKSKAKKILTGEKKTNDLRSAGTLISEPSVVISLVINDKDRPTAYGNFGLSEDDLDYLVHREEQVTLKDQSSYYRDNNVVAQVYTLDGSSVIVSEYTASPANGWVEK